MTNEELINELQLLRGSLNLSTQVFKAQTTLNRQNRRELLLLWVMAALLAFSQVAHHVFPGLQE